MLEFYIHAMERQIYDFKAHHLKLK